MKRLNTILIIVLILAVGVLYVLHFTEGKKTSVKPDTEKDANPTPVVDATIAYINIDTMLVQMEMYKDLQAGLAKKQKELEGTFKTKYNAFEKNVTDLQNKVNKGLVTRAEAEQMNQQLANDQMQLENLNNTYTQQIQEEGIVSNRKVIDYIMQYLKEYTKGKNIKFIFSYAFGGNLLYTDGAFDITNDILTGVNQKYLAEKVTTQK
jgi:outer membrane protein